MKAKLAFILGLLVVSAGCIGTIDGGGSGTVNLYASDQPAALDDFDSLDVTVDEVVLEQQTENGTEEVVHEFDEPRTFDLTQLVGDNATKLDSFDVPNGTYNGMSLQVTEVNGTLESGEQTDVMLPSNTLKLQQEFTIGDGEEVNFVYDMHVVKAGNSGKYIIRPVVAQSGVDQPINPVDTDQGGDDLGATFTAPPQQGEDATVRVTNNGEAVEGATVTVNGEEVGTTGADGTFTFQVPNEEELEVEIVRGDAEGELEVEFEEEEETDEETNETAGTSGR